MDATMDTQNNIRPPRFGGTTTEGPVGGDSDREEEDHDKGHPRTTKDTHESEISYKSSGTFPTDDR